MGDFQIKLKLLCDLLVKKHDLLSRILGITENQETILLNNNESSELNNIFIEMNEEKQKLINELIHTDSIFQKIFNEITPDFEERASNHKTEVRNLQDYVRAVTDLDVKIRLQERKNRDIISQAAPRIKIRAFKAPKEHVLKQYELNAQITKKNKYRKKD